MGILKRVDLSKTGNLLTVSVSLGMAMLVIANPLFFQALPGAVNMVLANSITLAGVSAVLLNLVYQHLD